MTIDIEKLIRQQVAGEVSFRVFDKGRTGVSLPLRYGDGDACEVVVKNINDETWSLSDEGYLLALGKMQGVNLLSAGYVDRFRQLAAFYGAEEQNGELLAKAASNELGDRLFVFCQGCVEISRLLDLPPDAKRKKRAFSRRFKAVVEAALPNRKFDKNWHDPQRDPKGIYGVDYRVAGKNIDWLIFGAGSPGKCWKAASSVQHYKLTDLPLKTVFAYSESAKGDSAAFGALADNANYQFSMELEKGKLNDFLRREVRL